MNLWVFAGVFVLLVALLAFLGWWQKRIEEDEKERVLDELESAKRRGTSKALYQYPIINVQACIGCGSCIAACPEDEVLGLVDGVARVIHGARCIGHARCADACPVAAIKVGLGDISGRTDLPRLTESLETTQPGIYIAGELGGFALIRIAIEQGTKAIDAIQESLRGAPPCSKGTVDVLIVGAGPAGIAASLRAKEKGLEFVTIDQDTVGGTVSKYPRRKLTLVGEMELPLFGRVKKKEFLKEELVRFWEELIRKHHLPVHTGTKLQQVLKHGAGFLVKTSRGKVRARKIVLALGRRGSPRKLGVPGEDAAKVLYQLVDTASYRNDRILVVGGGDSAVEAATGLADQKGNRVTLSYRRENFFRLKARNEERIARYQRDKKLDVLFQSEVKAIGGDSVQLEQAVNGVKKLVGLENDYVFIFAGGEAPYPFLRELGVRFHGDDLDEKAATAAPEEAVTHS